MKPGLLAASVATLCLLMTHCSILDRRRTIESLRRGVAPLDAIPVEVVRPSEDSVVWFQIDLKDPRSGSGRGCGLHPQADLYACRREGSAEGVSIYVIPDRPGCDLAPPEMRNSGCHAAMVAASQIVFEDLSVFDSAAEFEREANAILFFHSLPLGEEAPLCLVVMKNSLAAAARSDNDWVVRVTSFENYTLILRAPFKDYSGCDQIGTLISGIRILG